MHRQVRDQIGSVLGGSPDKSSQQHLEQCLECSQEASAMREQIGLLRVLRPSTEAEPRAGFYARVMERIEAQRPISIWNLFFESAMGRGLAMASMVFALAMGIYLVSSERTPEQTTIVINGRPDWVLSDEMTNPGVAPDRDSVLVNLVTYREQ